MLENTLFETHFDIIPFPIYVVDIQTYEIIFSNVIFNELFDNSKGLVCHQALYAREAPCIECKISALVENGAPTGETLIFERFNDADDRWYQHQEKAMSWPDGRIVKYSIAVDITELKVTQNRLAEAHAELALKNRSLEILSITDPLTGVLNRLKLDENIKTEVERAERYQSAFSMIMVDLDHFKEVNDTHGHPAGDTVLKEVVALFQENIRKVDILGRYGGEEFLLLCPETDMEGAVQIAEKLRAAVQAHDFTRVGRLTASFGVSTFTPGATHGTMLFEADAALYQAKDAGRNRVERC